jgi:hypothetical protein
MRIHHPMPNRSSNHPETDMTEFLDEEGIQMYQSLIGSMQWAIIIGCFEIAVHVVPCQVPGWHHIEDILNRPNAWLVILLE